MCLLVEQTFKVKLWTSYTDYIEKLKLDFSRFVFFFKLNKLFLLYEKMLEKIVAEYRITDDKYVDKYLFLLYLKI